MSKVETLKKYITENETYDNDFWDLGGNKSLRFLMIDFSSEDWYDLKNQTKNWSSHQLCILADALIDDNTKFEFDVNEFYGELFTIVDDSEADYLIQHIKIIDDGKAKPLELLVSIKNRIEKLKKYTEKIHNVHDYADYFFFIDKLIKASC
ncbi:hypothetical protein [Empedobacter falsenii]|uniref:hypothetical protein n=1 Tax=Empedobacter falsenii TaxID=343874 RepID=UPI000571A122|nr:hypothetical protein [Empedobacter falsenii]